MNTACTKEKISIFHVVHKTKQSTFNYEATLKVVKGVFSICLVPTA